MSATTKPVKCFFSLCCAFACCVSARAASLPDLHSQAAWGEKEKQEFLGYIKSNQPAPAGGQVKYFAADKGGRAKPSKARYAALSLITDTMIIDSGSGVTRTETATLGPKLVVGGHLFSWVRYYTGLKYNRIGQERLDGRRGHMSHFEIPLGLELALIPLGTPHTRYVLLRGGISEHYITGGKKSDFSPSLQGWRAAWNLGVGYEWQIPDTRWRFNILAEAYRTFAVKGPSRFSGAGLTTGLAYTF